VQQRASDVGSGRIAAPATLVGIAWFALQAVRLAREKYFSIDEFQYAHAAWLVARGQVPYRDFFEVHFPLVYQALAPVFLVLGDDPTAVVGLRVGMLVFLALACAAGASVNRSEGWSAALLAPLFLLALPPFVTLATEIRPDAAAFALFLAALGALRLDRFGDRTCAFAGGVLLVGAVWGSQKAALYGSIFVPALLLDLFPRARTPASDGRPRLLRSPLWFLTGAASAAASIALYLSATRSWAPWWSWCFTWAAEHQRHYPAFSWRRYFDPILVDGLWAFALAALGLAATLRRLRERGRGALADPDLLLVGALATTFASFALQRAPYPYSLLPFLGIVAVLAARGAALLLYMGGMPLRTAFAAALVAVLILQSAALGRFIAASNARQLEVLARVGEITAPTDPAYDNSGGYVSRPHAYFYFYTDSYLRSGIPETLAREGQQAIIDTGAVLHLGDLRFDTLPPSLRAFLVRHFQPLDGDVSLWGQHYVVPESGRLEATFLAVRPDRYFVSPAEAIDRGTLLVDGRRLTEPVFALEKGDHAVSYSGPAGELDILWLPRDGKPWTPRRGLAPTFSRLF
jgi:hypothetical protein